MWAQDKTPRDASVYRNRGRGARKGEVLLGPVRGQPAGVAVCADSSTDREAVSRAELIRKAGLVGGPQTFCTGFEVLFAIAVTISCVLTIRHLYKL